MKEFEIHAFVSYISGEEKYHDCFTEYVPAKSASEAKKIYKAQLKEEGITLIRAEIIEA